MDVEEREALGRQLKGVMARAKREKAVLTGFTWRDGRVIPVLVHSGKVPAGEAAPPVAEPPPIPKKARRTLVQVELPL